MLQDVTGSDGLFAALIVFLVLWYVTPTAIAALRGVPVQALLQVILLNVIPLGWPGALIMALLGPGRERRRPVVEIPRVRGYSPDRRYPAGDPRAGYPLP